MLSDEKNRLITQTGPGTPGGDMMRAYWQPAALSRELKADEPLPIRLLGEDLVMFRDEQGKPQLISRHCPHRQADLSYGRVEGGGIRCIYHGWLMDGKGRCIELPCEPNSVNKSKASVTSAYPCHEGGGLIMAYLGKGEPPELPSFHFLAAGPGQTFTMKVYQECNYLQGNEGNIDPAHLSFLHRFLPEGVAEGLSLRTGRLNEILAQDQAPDIRVVEAPFGLRISAWRTSAPGRRWARLTNFVMPNASAIHGSPITDPRKDPIPENSGYQLNWHVPIDDYTHWKYVVAYRFDGPLDFDFMLSQFDEVDADFHIDRNRDNRFRQNRAEMKTRSFAGLGPSFFLHDKCVVETQGVIMDRSKEHLGSTDRAVVMMRKQLLAAIDSVRAGHDPLMVHRKGQSSPVEQLRVLSAEISADTDLDTEWWSPYFEAGWPILPPKKRVG